MAIPTKFFEFYTNATHMGLNATHCLNIFDRQALTALAIATLASMLAVVESKNFLFICLFIFRYLRLIVHMISFWLYKPIPIPTNPTYFPADCTVIIPTIDPENPDFIECLTSVLANNPGEILIVTVGVEKLNLTREIVAPFNRNITVTATNIANKRGQVCHAMPNVRTRITVLVDDHVFWPSTSFLINILAPFEDPNVATVGTNKRVRRTERGFTWAAFWNLIGALYLERHNFELAATNNIDGGVFVISGRTSAHRTLILQDPAFIAGFTNERFFFGLFGPLNADDDNFITRWEVRRGWKIRFQSSAEATIETTLGSYPKFLSQCLRWARTTWRSNAASLFTDRTVWRTQRWCLYAVYWTSFFNFALFTDAALLYTLARTSFSGGGGAALPALAAWILASKLVKPFPHFWRNPADFVFLPGYILFGYYHSLLKLYALLTFWNASWGGRDLAAIGNDDGGDDHSPDDGNDSSSDDSGPSRGNPTDPGSTSASATDSSGSGGDGSGRKSTSGKFESLLVKRRGSSVQTPWGRARTPHPEHTPANVREAQTPPVKKKTTTTTTTTGAGKSVRAASPGAWGLQGGAVVAAKTPPFVYRRTWARGGNCERLHYDAYNLIRGNCVLSDAGM